MTDDIEEVSKSQITISPPGMPLRFAALASGRGPTRAGNQLVYDKKFQYGVYYDMYTQHPYVRAVIDKLSKYAVTSGYRFVPTSNEDTPDKTVVRKLERFFRKSKANHLLRMTFKDLMIFGESFWFIERNLLGAPRRAMRLHPMYCSPVVFNGDVVEYRYGTNVTSPAQDNALDVTTYQLNEIIHFKVDDPDNDVAGLSPLQSLTRTVAADISAMEFNGNFFENSAQTGIVFSMENSTADEAKRNREYLEQNYVGTRNAHRPLLLEGTVKVEKSVSTYQEMQFVEGRKLWRQEILSVFDIDGRKIGISGEAGSSKGAATDDSFHTESVAGWQSIVEETINEDLLLEILDIQDHLFEHNVKDPRSLLNQMTFFRDAVRDGIFVRNDVRASLGYGPIKGGEIATVQTSTGLLPLDKVGEMAEKLLQQPQAGSVVNAKSQPGIGTKDNEPGAGRPPSDRNEKHE